MHHQAPLTRLACAITIKVASREGAAAVFTRIAPWDLPLWTKLPGKAWLLRRIQFSSVTSDSLRSDALQHARFPCL